MPLSKYKDKFYSKPTLLIIDSLLSAHNDDVVSPPSTSANSPELSKTALANAEEPNQP